uniref:G-protein coupled receptors family 1 profile domain-containing protein n=1 Tax=Sus scrofa TaxID=9823 RepID=A0A8D1EEE5_PIG
MGRRNDTHVSDFILLGLTDSEAVQRILFMLFLLIYLMTLLGNAGMMLIIRLDLQLHTPMYFFLSHLSFLDLSYSTVITPQTLENLLTSTKYISYMNSICNPLHYPVVMSTRSCCSLVFGSYFIGFMDSFVNVLSISRLDFCDSNMIHHFFCDISPILALSCTDTQNTEIITFILAGSTLVVSLTTIVMSYVSILSTILKITSTSGKQRAFSTCASHLLGVTVFYGTMIFTYLKPSKSYSLGRDQVASVFYTIVIPMLNPLIYSLRNKEVKNAFIRVIQKTVGSRQVK